jgi:hypothetical protein
MTTMRSAVRTCTLTLAALTAACGGSAATRPATTSPVPDARPLAFLVSSGAIVTPTFALRLAPQLDWDARIGDSREILRGMDAAIATAFAERGLRHGWVLASDLAVTYKRNPNYATDPYALAEEPLRSPAFAVGMRLPEPLASQLRTMIALHEGARLTLLPVQLSLEEADRVPGAARASLRLALVDPRFSEARWIGEVRGDTVSADPRVLTASLARRVADLIVSR